LLFSAPSLCCILFFRRPDLGGHYLGCQLSVVRCLPALTDTDRRRRFTHLTGSLGTAARNLSVLRWQSLSDVLCPVLKPRATVPHIHSAVFLSLSRPSSRGGQLTTSIGVPATRASTAHRFVRRWYSQTWAMIRMKLGHRQVSWSSADSAGDYSTCLCNCVGTRD
jgi:hypothetical protein